MFDSLQRLFVIIEGAPRSLKSGRQDIPLEIMGEKGKTISLLTVAVQIISTFIIFSLLIFSFAGCSGGGGGSTSSSDKKGVTKAPFLGRTYIGSSRCTYCHEGTGEIWKTTKHASAFAIVEGTGSECYRCHTTGFSKSADNGGYDENPIKKFENVGCESCHQAGAKYSMHYTARSARGLSNRTLMALKAEVCGYCHTKNVDDSVSKGQYDLWVNSPFPNSLENLEGHPEVNNSCLKCHSADKIYDSSVTLGEARNAVTCGACHSPHGSGNDFQLRAQGDVELPGPITNTTVSAGKGAICYTCHNDQIKNVDDAVSEGVTPRFNQAQMFSGTGAYEFGETIDDSFHSGFDDKCLTCHGFDTPADGETGHNTIGGHTFRVIDKDGNMLFSACQQCHDGLVTFNKTARGDYDGDGTKEGIQSEIDGLLELLKTEILKSGNVTEGADSFSRSYFIFSSSATDEEKQSAFNWSFVNSDKSRGVHNTEYAVKLLQISYKKLTGTDVPGAVIR